MFFFFPNECVENLVTDTFDAHFFKIKSFILVWNTSVIGATFQNISWNLEDYVKTFINI